MQNNLTEASLTDAINAYILASAELGFLDVIAYQWDNSNKFKGAFHIFARSKTAPYRYYYRRTDTSRGLTFWNPWQKIDVDVPSYETDADGNMLRVAGSYLVPAVWK